MAARGGYRWENTLERGSLEHPQTHKHRIHSLAARGSKADWAINNLLGVTDVIQDALNAETNFAVFMATMPFQLCFYGAHLQGYKFWFHLRK